MKARFAWTARLLALVRKELLQLRRDRLTLAMTVVLPVTMLLLFGYAINTDVRHLPTLVLDQDASAESRALAAKLQATGIYDVVGAARDEDDITTQMRSGVARVGVVIPARYGEDLARGRTVHVQLLVDGSDPQTVAGATETAASFAAAESTSLLVSKLGEAGAPAQLPLVVEPSTFYNPDARTAVYIVPGLVGVLLTMTLVMLTSMAIARERERGTLEQLVVSPLGRFEVIFGKILPYVLIGYAQMTLVLGVGGWVFGIPVVGSLPLLYALAALFIGGSLAVGLLFSTIAKTQQQAMQLSFFFLLPNILLSGFMFPWEGMPAPARWLSLGLPLTHFLRIVRGVVLKGSSFTELAHEATWLLGIFVVLVVVAASRFDKKLA